MSDHNKGRVEEILKELGRKIDHLIEDAKGAKDEIRDDIEEKIEELKSRKDKLEEEFEEFKKKNDPKWQEIKTHLNNAAEEIRLAAESAFKRK